MLHQTFESKYINTKQRSQSIANYFKTFLKIFKMPHTKKGPGCSGSYLQYFMNSKQHIIDFLCVKPLKCCCWSVVIFCQVQRSESSAQEVRGEKPLLCHCHICLTNEHFCLSLPGKTQRIQPTVHKYPKP